MGNSSSSRTPYPKPGRVGGKLIREVIGFLKAQNIALPLDSHILCAVSGGSDSLALARLLIQYGRKIAPRKKIILLHVNHGWRGEESDGDARFVRSFARAHKVKCVVVRARPPRALKSAQGESWENVARKQRKRIFKRMAKKYGASTVLTAHHADDLAETMLWRIFTGAAASHSAGIRVSEGMELRPLLQVRKRRLKDFLQEEGLGWREDMTNEGGRFLRSQMRVELMPTIERLFPRAVEHLVNLAFAVQKVENAMPAKAPQPEDWIGTLLSQIGIRGKRAHFEFIKDKTLKRGEIHLPEGWRLRGERSGQGDSAEERWVLERQGPESF